MRALGSNVQEYRDACLFKSHQFMALGLDVIGRSRMVFDASNDAMYLSKGIDADANPDAFQ